MMNDEVYNRKIYSDCFDQDGLERWIDGHSGIVKYNNLLPYIITARNGYKDINNQYG